MSGETTKWQGRCDQLQGARRRWEVADYDELIGRGEERTDDMREAIEEGLSA